MQAPYLFPGLRWFFFICGYAAGKTKANVISLLYAIKKLQYKKDRSGDYARIIVAGYTLAHLNKTFLVYLRQILDQSKTPYTENKKDNFMIIGTVTVFIVPIENPENIFGFDACACVHRDTKVLARRGGKVQRTAVKNMFAGDEVFTRKGWRKVVRVLQNGKKPVVRINGLRCTTDHKILSQGWREAGDLAEGDVTYTTSAWRVKIWTKLCGLLKLSEEGVLCLTRPCNSSIRTERAGLRSAIFNARKLRAVSVIFILLFGSVITAASRRDMLFIIKTASQLITVLKTLLRCRERSSHTFYVALPVGCIAMQNAMTLICTLKERLRADVCVGRGRVRYAGKLSRLLSVLLALPALRTVRTLKEGEQHEVYDLTVDGHEAHEFFADGILVHNCFVEEVDELTEDKAIEAVRSLSERCRQQIRDYRSPFLCLASTSQGQKGLYRIYTHFKKNGTGFLLLRGRTEDNLFLPKALIDDMKRTYTPEEKRCYMDGEFISIASGRVLGDFNWEKNYLDYDLDTELEPNETVYIGMDFNTGYNRASAYVVRKGVLYCIKYYDFPDPQDAPAVYRHDFPRQRILWLPDVTIKDSFPQYARELRKYGIQIGYRKKSPLVEDSCFLVNKLFYTGRLLICRIAKDVAEACALFMRDKDHKIPAGKGPSSPAHCVDGVRYACTFIASRHKDFRDIRRLVLDRFISFRDEDEDVKDLGGGYVQIRPEAYLRRK
jgi:hypothetical protein